MITQKKIDLNSFNKKKLSCINALKIELFRSLLFVCVSLVFIKILLFIEFWAFRKEGISKIKDYIVLLNLPSWLGDRWSIVFKKILSSIEFSLFNTVLRVYISFLIFLMVFELIRFLIKMVFSVILKNSEFSNTDQVEFHIRNKLFFFGIFLFIVVSILIVIYADLNGIPSIGMKFAFLPVFPFLIILIIYYVVKWKALKDSSSSLRKSIIKYFSRPYRRLQNWIDMFLLVVGFLSATNIFLPFVFRNINEIQTKIEKRIQKENLIKQIDSLKITLISEIKKKKPKIDVDGFLETVAPLLSCSEIRKSWTIPQKGFSEKELMSFLKFSSVAFRLIVMIVFIGFVILPPLILGIYKGRLIGIFLTSIIPIPALYFFDKMGMTSKMHFLWFFSTIPFAIGDAMLSSKTYNEIGFFIKNRTVIHQKSDCPVLKDIPNDRIKKENIGALIRTAYFTKCKICFRENKFEDQKKP